MPLYREAISAATVTLPRRDLKQMARLVRTLYRLSRSSAYREAVLPELPEVARFDPGHDAVMMGYDFHLTPQGPRLIEVNTNAGGALLAYLTRFPDADTARAALPGKLRERFLAPFAEEWRRFGRGPGLPHRVVILDQEPERQYLYGEMLAFSELFRQADCRAAVADPGELDCDERGVALAGEAVGMVYNRHCDFYLEEPETAGLRAAYLAGAVCLTPTPFSYGLLADKRRLALWSRGPEELARFGLTPEEAALVSELVPESRLLSDLGREAAWDGRKEWVFKPVDRFGSRGVFLGRKISRARFDELPPESTLAQRLVPPSETAVEGSGAMKTDLRLYAYRDHVIGVAARLYQGQVTNLRTPGGGFAPVRVA